VIDHRKVQRVLFLMQLSPACARRVFQGEETFGLKADEAALLLSLDPVAVAANRQGKRTDQLLGNTTSEYHLTVALATQRREPFLDGFLDHGLFRASILENTSLALAFGSYAASFAEEHNDSGLLEIVRLELAMVRARRAPRAVEAPVAGELSLAPEANVVELADGTVARASAIRSALDAGHELFKNEDRSSDAREEALLVVRHRPRHGLPDVDVERLEPLVGALLNAAREGLDDAGRAAFSEERGLQRSDLDAFVDELVSEGVLLRGT
jgi:hypothetical protein